MSEEIELKLLIAPAALPALLKSAPFAALGVRFRPARKLVTAYYDTKKGALRAKGIFLRVRQDGARFTQAVKTAGDSALLARRGEWEWRLPSAAPDLALAAETGLKPLVRLARKDKAVGRLFASELTRRTALVTIGETELELALDQGEVRAGRRSAPLLELEIEAKSGPLGPLFALARKLAAQPGVSAGFATKAARGFALAAGRKGGIAKAPSLDLTPQLSLGEAAALILDACAGHAAANLEAVTAERLPEGIHQLRVALRRLRAALAVFKEVLPDERRKALRKAAGQLAGRLGAARELDVLLAGLAAAAAPAALAGDLMALKRRLAAARRAAWSDALAAVAESATTLLVDLAETAHELRDTPPLPETPALAAFAAAELEQRFEEVLAAGPDLEALSIAARHELRLALKKLRYAADFFAALFPHKAAKTGTKVLAALQEALGAFNDAATVEPLLAKVVAAAPEKAAPGLERAAAFVAGWAAHQGEAAWGEAQARWADFTERGAFWR